MTPPPRLKALVVEDDPIIQKLLRHKLEEIGVDVVGSARSVKKGSVLARSIDADIALLDVFLGIDHSFSIAKILEARGIPYIYVTGVPLQIDLNLQFFATYVEKPVRMDDLKAAISLSLQKNKKFPASRPNRFGHIAERIRAWLKGGRSRSTNRSRPTD